MPKPKVILFDLGNVVVKLRTPQFLARMAQVCDARWDDAAILEAIREPAGPHIDYEKGFISGQDFHRHLQRRFALRLDYAGWLTVWNDYFEPNRPMEALLTRLRGQVRFFGLTNTNAEHIGHAKRNYRVLDLFEGIIASNEVGLRKPDLAIFALALQRAGVAAQDVLYIDDIERFMAPAEALGLQTFNYIYNDAALRERLLQLGFELPHLGGHSSTASC